MKTIKDLQIKTISQLGIVAEHKFGLRTKEDRLALVNYWGDLETEDAKKVAKLLAAAPDLLEALKIASSMLSRYCPNEANDGSVNGQLLGIIHNAIEKATLKP